MLTKSIEIFKNIESEKFIEYDKSKNIQKEYSLILEQSKIEFKKNSFFKRMFLSSKKRKEIKELEIFIADEKRNSERILSYIKSEKQKLYKDLTNQLINEDMKATNELKTINDRISYINKIYNTFSKTVKAGDFAISEIKDALNSVDSAQSMETLDLLSSNKAFSILSMIDNDTAKNDTKSAKDAIENFKKELEYTKVMIDNIQLDTTWGTFDFIIDITMDNGILGTFSSFMALSALNDAEKNLKNANEIVSNVLKDIKKEYSEILKQKTHEENVKTDFMKKYEIKAKLYLKDNKIDL